MAQHNDLGKKGEKLSQEYLHKQGYTILETNWRYKKAEIDIIALKNNILIVAEVKTRSSEHYGKPEIFVNQKKIKLLMEAINHYVEKNDLNYEIRFDIISVIINQYRQDIKHIQDAYYWY